MLFIFGNISYSQNEKSKQEFLTNFAVCDCLTMAFHKAEKQINDPSGNYWCELSTLSRQDQEKFDDFVVEYVNKMK